ncbi:MAG: lysostaphin resistance A-like protein [Armatimonadota bacterium]
MTPTSVYPVPEIAFAGVALFLLLASVACAAYLLLRPVGGRDTWGIGEILAITVLFVIALPMGAILLGLAEPLTLTSLSIVTIVQNALFAGLSAYVVMVRYRQHPLRLGVRLDGWHALVAIGLVAAVITIPLSVASERLAILVYGLIEGPAQAVARAAEEHMADPLRPVFDQLSGPTQAAWLLFLLAIVVPIGEEVFFRGLVYGGLRARWGKTVAALGSAVFFSAVHVQVIHALPIFVLGVILATLYERSGSLVPPIVAHGVNNVIAVISVWRGWEI